MCQHVLQDGDIGGGAIGGVGMSVIAGDPAAEFEELRGGMFVRGRGRTECELP